jgi:hypothetical protein
MRRLDMTHGSTYGRHLYCNVNTKGSTVATSDGDVSGPAANQHDLGWRTKADFPVRRLAWKGEAVRNSDRRKSLFGRAGF